MNNVEKLAKVLSRKFGHLKLRKDYGPSDPALNVLDCVLSLNRRYYSFVEPRIKSFAKSNPRVTGLRSLYQLIKKYRTPRAFGIKQLRYDHGERANTLLGVIRYLLRVQKRYPRKTERARLRAWALSAKPSDVHHVGVDGFGLAGFQYMRMLFGAQTTKPDIHIKRFVSEVIGRPVNDLAALSLLEQAARRERLMLREVDSAIWRSRAHKQKRQRNI